MLGRRVGTQLGERAPEQTWEGIGEHMRAADACAVNLECVIAESGRPAPGRRFHFQAPPEALDVLQAAGVDVVSVANNHVLDMGPRPSWSHWSAWTRQGSITRGRADPWRRPGNPQASAWTGSRWVC